MTVKASSPEINIRSNLSKVQVYKAPPRYHTFFFDGDSSTTTFSLPSGWRVTNVFVGGSIFRPGSSEDYTTTLDVGVESVVFAVAPAVTDIAIMAVSE